MSDERAELSDAECDAAIHELRGVSLPEGFMVDWCDRVIYRAARASSRETVERLQADAERIDWLESTLVMAEKDLGVKCGWYVDESGAPIMRGELEALWSRTLRAAIDAARRVTP